MSTAVRMFKIFVLLTAACSGLWSKILAGQPDRTIRNDSSSAVNIRLKRSIGKVQIYEGRQIRSQTGQNNYNATDDFYLTIACNDQAEGFDLLALRQTFLERSRQEILENNRKVDRIQPNTDELLDLGPNSKFVAGMRCYAFDAQNQLAFFPEDVVMLKDGTLLKGVISAREPSHLTLETKDGQKLIAAARVHSAERVPIPHVLNPESMHYFFPIFSRRAVTEGESWAFTVPVIIPLEQGDRSIVLATQFDLRMEARLRSVRSDSSGTLALIDYKIAGTFDTANDRYKDRFGEAFRERTRIIHDVAGTGSISVNLSNGIMLEKTEQFTVKLYAKSFTPQPNNQPPREDKSEATIKSAITLKWLPPGVKLRSGAVVPPLE